MKTLVLDGKKYAEYLAKSLTKKVSKMVEKPVLATVLVGDDEASIAYVNAKSKKAKEIGIEIKNVKIDKNISSDDLLSIIDSLNNDDKIDGILIQHPLPKKFNEGEIFDKISPLKDVDGLNKITFGAMAFGDKDSFFNSATPLAVIDLLKYYKVNIVSKHIVVVGRSRILGKPLAMMLLNENATVTICHSKTNNLSEITKMADILIAAIGSPKFIKKDMLKKDAVLVDCGYNKGNIGDIDLEESISICKAYTPVPGGVGPVTIMKLLEQVVKSKEKRRIKDSEYYKR